MGLYDIVVNNGYIETLISELEVYADSIETQVEEIFTDIENMEESWSGESYDAFSQSVMSYKPAFDSIAETTRAYANILRNQITPEATELESKIKTALG